MITAGDSNYRAVLEQAAKGHTVEVIFYEDFVKSMDIESNDKKENCRSFEANDVFDLNGNILKVRNGIKINLPKYDDIEQNDNGILLKAVSRNTGQNENYEVSIELHDNSDIVSYNDSKTIDVESRFLCYDQAAGDDTYDDCYANMTEYLALPLFIKKDDTDTE